MSDMSNGKTYTEVLLDVYDKLDTVEQRIVRKIDVIAKDNAECKERMARGEAKVDSLDEKIDAYYKKVDKRIDTNVADITKVRNLNAVLTALFSSIAAFVGLSK